MSLRALVPLAFLLVLASGCGGLQSPETGTLFPVEVDDAQGAVTLTGAGMPSGERAFFVLEPDAWPVEGQGRPPLAFGEISGWGGAPKVLLYSGVQADFATSRARIVETLPEDWTHKGLRVLRERAGDEVHFATADTWGIAPGDWYFVLHHAPTSAADGLSGRIGALLRVETVGEQTGTARIVHERSPVRAGDVALFAQASGPATRISARIGLGDSRSGETGSATTALQDALIALIEAWDLEDVELRTWTIPLDPADETTSLRRLAAEEPELPPMVVGMLDRVGDDLLYAHASHGAPPRLAQLVGVLPGGMPLPGAADDSTVLEGLASALLSTALAARGDTALALYLSIVQSEAPGLADHVRYHLREHVVLAMEQLGARQEAYAIITADLEAAEAADDIYTILNSLSIRSHVLERQRKVEEWLDDALRFQSLAREHLPASSPTLLHIPVIRALRANGQIDEAEAALSRLDAALGEDALVDDRFSLALHRALVRVRDEDSAGALLALELAPDILEALDADQRALLHSLAAEFYALSGQNLRRSYGEHIALALEAAQDAGNAGTRAFTYRRIGELFLILERPQEAIGAFEAAVDAMLEYGDLEEAAGLYARVGFLRLETAQQLPPQRIAPMLVESLRSLQRGADLALRLGASSDAAQVLLLAALLDQRFGNLEAAEEGMRISYRLALASAQGELAMQAAAQLRDLAAERGDFDSYQHYEEIAEMWSEFLGIPLDDVEQDSEPSL